MQKRICTFIVLFISIFITNTFAQNFPNYILKNTEIRELKSEIADKEYELIIHLPSGYNPDSIKKYPVVYFCDGFYDIALFSAIYGQQVYDKTITECFLVGFSYPGENPDYHKLRRYELSPTQTDEPNPTGGAPEFLEVVEQEIIPFVENNYNVDSSFRALAGSSMGGLFTLYSLFTKPNLFDAYIAVGPAVMWDNNWLYNYAENFHKNNTELPVSLFMTGGEKELLQLPDYLPAILRFDELLKKHNYKNFNYEFRFLENTHHSGAKAEGFSRGMTFIFAPLLNK